MPSVTEETLRKRAQAVRIGGKGSARRTVKAHHKSSGDDKRVQGTLKRLGVTPLNDIDEAVFHRTDGTAYVFQNPKVQASMQTQCFVVTGPYSTVSSSEVKH